MCSSETTLLLAPKRKRTQHSVRLNQLLIRALRYHQALYRNLCQHLVGLLRRYELQGIALTRTRLWISLVAVSYQIKTYSCVPVGTYTHVDIIPKHACPTSLGRLLNRRMSLRQLRLLRLHRHVAKIHGKEVARRVDARALNV